MVNVVTLLGKVSDAGVKLTYRENGTPECRWVMIPEETGQDGKVFRSFIPAFSFGKAAETIAEQIEPGDLVLIESGRLKMRQWTPPKGGEPQRRLEVLAWNVSVVTAPHAAVSTT